MFTLLKLVQSLVKALNSEGTPGQVAAGIALGSIVGLTPFFSLHNLLMVAVIFLFNVSVPGAMLGWLVFTPAGFMLDPAFDRLGAWLLIEQPVLEPLWRAIAGVPVLPLSNFNNTVLLGSVVGWVVLAFPIFLGSRWAISRYRETIYVRIQGSKLFKAVIASRLFNVYRLLRP